ncbi:cytochrome c oxidase subunit 3 [Ehrlichia ruminantium]|uniref:cytochrome-c oxidase n=1 Tax=Ehrlichia ruminantium TaxID=779 RepID=A0AAE6UJ77_EHRRU|nr:cytochrome c oxidase subunit 3 [Ehrlichia ruminantium]QGR03026.1 cytochrome c oxidase subunit 3 [Ehrlichia ruminantium]QGR03951.1 cytochrome c oxidase subunit 3 [Ehrlichia ruminantium]
MKGKLHDYHLVNPSPWPLLFSITVLITALGAVGTIRNFYMGQPLLLVGLTSVSFTLYKWWKDVVTEAIKDNCHTDIVKKGLRLAMAGFILAESMFFFGFFWSFFKAWLFPVHTFDNLIPGNPITWPPHDIARLDPWSIPFLNTIILLLSGSTLTWSHYSLVNNDNSSALRLLGATIILGTIFSIFQAIEYLHTGFAFHETGEKAIYASNFYMITGFHGLHVIVGTLFLIVCWFRIKKGQLSPEHHIGFECAAWYWHFVDVIWLLLFVFLYWISS